jgi:asparagine synthase (glutamine-hydrolysing)
MHHHDADTHQTYLWELMQITESGYRPVQTAFESGHPHPHEYLAISASGLMACTLTDRVNIPDAWVRVGHQLRLGRDPFGRVSIYWLGNPLSDSSFLIWFSTHFQQLLSLLGQSPTINLEALYGYAGCSYVPTPHTPIAGIHAIPAATEFLWDGGDVSLSLSPQRTRYWQWQQAPEQLTDEGEAIAQLQSLLQASIARQLPGITGKAGVFLSGGLDSSIVASLLVKAGVDVHAYSLDVGDEPLSELPYAQQVADALGIPLTTVRATPRRVKRAIAPTAHALGLPFGDGVTVPLYLLNQAVAADGVRVVFNGENGDQLFAGWTNKPLIAAGIYDSVHQAASSVSQDALAQHYLKTFHRLYGYESQSFSPEMYQQVQAFDPHAWLDDSLSDEYCQTFLHKMRRATLMLKGAQNIQPRATALAWSQGLQVRSPFCDMDLATWSFRVSGDLHLRGNCEKYILKRAVEAWLPPEIVWRDKRGMGVPLTQWCVNPFWHDLGRWLNPSTLRTEGLWHPHLPMRVASYQVGGIQGRRVGEILWMLMMWQQWRIQVLGHAPGIGSLDHPFWIPPWLWTIMRKEILQ